MRLIRAKLPLHVARVLICLASVMPVCTFLNTPAAAQTQGPAHRPAAPAKSTATDKPASSVPARFSAAGLNNEDDLLRIYSGDFQSVRLDRNGSEFMQIISSYMTDYANECKQFLPPNKVEITTQVCNDSPSPSIYSRDGVHDIYGNVIQTSGCSSYRTVGTGLYADPQLYAAVNDVAAKAQVNMLGNMLGMKTGKGGHPSGPFSMPQQMVDQLVAVGDEMKAVIHTNTCGSAGLRNFQSNLTRFANGESPIKFAGAVVPAVIPGEPAKDTDFARLLDDLVAGNARGWLVNRYQRGSITDPIVARDPLGDPVRVLARYSYSDTQGTQRGRVTVSFKDGSPDCLYFSDAPDTCRVPAANVVSAYEKNAYAKSSGESRDSPNTQLPKPPGNAAAEAQLQHAREQQAAREQRDKDVLAADAAGNPDAKIPAQMVRREQEDNRQRWAATTQSPAAYDPRWMGQKIAIVGTVSRVEVDHGCRSTSKNPPMLLSSSAPPIPTCFRRE